MRLPEARVCAIASSIVFTASSASFGASLLCLALSSSMSCDLVMARSPPGVTGVLFLVLRARELRLQQCAEVGGAGARAALRGVLLQGGGLFGRVLLLDG